MGDNWARYFPKYFTDKSKSGSILDRWNKSAEYQMNREISGTESISGSFRGAWFNMARDIYDPVWDVSELGRGIWCHPIALWLCTAVRRRQGCEEIEMRCTVLGARIKATIFDCKRFKENVDCQDYAQFYTYFMNLWRSAKNQTTLLIFWAYLIKISSNFSVWPILEELKVDEIDTRIVL